MIRDFLDYVLFNNGEFAFTVSRLISIIVLLLLVRIALFLFKRFIYKYLASKNVHESRRESFYLLVKYFLWVVATVATLEMVGIHITILIAGSAALLVGLGLGLQQIFQDLVSGIFILIEGTIKVNDVIELHGMVGRILSVNIRTSKVLTRDGIIIIVPNHKFIVENITNWSHNSDSTRFKVDVGVAYGSDVQKVKEILLACAKKHKEIIDNPAEPNHLPFVRFVDFGESSLDFELFFWTTNIFNVEHIKSDLRFEIDRMFREQGVTIPFPQRDLHIKSNSTILP